MHTSRILMVALVALGLSSAPGIGAAQGGVCYDHLGRTTYDTGFLTTSFESIVGLNITGGVLVLTPDSRQLVDSNRLTVSTRQQLSAHYVFEGAGASASFGWFLFDGAMDPYVTLSGMTFTATPCATAADCAVGMSCESNGTQTVCAYPKHLLRDDGAATGTWAGNKAYDWFEALFLKTCQTCTPLLLTSPYSDASRGGSLDHVPNLLESLMSTQGAWIFKLADDDSDTSVYSSLAPVPDSSNATDGIPDYDVNGDGVIDALDRSVVMGTFDPGSEIVFFATVYFGQDVRKASVGMNGQLVCPSPCVSGHRDCAWCIANCSPSEWDNNCNTANNCMSCRPYYAEDDSLISTRILPFFSKRVLNPDYLASGSASMERDIGCARGSVCNGYPGWLDQTALDRLSSQLGLTLPHEVKTFQTRVDGQADHFFVGSPTTEANWWLLGLEDLYDQGDLSFNDLVFVVFRQNGGESVSKIITDELTADQKAASTITKVRIRKRDLIPSPPCSTDPDRVRIDYYVSIGADQGGQPVWVKVDFPPSSDEAVVDMQDVGAAGTDLRWKAAIITDDHLCMPQVLDVDVGYEAMKSGEYLFTSPVPLANALFRGGLETRSAGWTVTGGDYSNRGHLRMYELYRPDTPETMTKTELWDAGARLASLNPDSRVIFSHLSGTRENLNAASGTSVLSLLLSVTDRAERHNARPVYDLDGDGDSDDDDARALIQWTRGWETPSTQQRAWKLGAIHKSMPAVVHVPGEPEWVTKVGIPTTLRTSFRDWAALTAQTERRTVAYVGSQSGMLHAFDAGSFRWGDNPETGILENRGYFMYTSGQPDYGTGNELFAYVPPSLLGDLKNNRVRGYNTETHPQAMVDGALVVSDVHGVFPFSPTPSIAQWRTGVFFSLGRQHPAVSALDVTDSNDPRPLWASDWTDADFHGTHAAPSVSFVPGTTEPRWAMALGSGLSDTPVDLYLYVVDVPSGATLSKVKLNQGTGSSAEPAYGAAGRAVMVDQDDNGVADRVYLADTNGRIWRQNLDAATPPCLVAELGQPIYHTPAFLVRQDTSNRQVVTFYVGTADRPDQDDTTTPPYWFYAFADEDETAAECHTASLLWKYELPPDEKVWADPAISAEQVYVGTATGDKAHICDENTANPGHIYVFDLDPTSANQPSQPEAPITAEGNVLSGLMVFDQHVLLNTVGGKTVIIGGSAWNNISALLGASQMKDTYWYEVVTK